MRSIFALFILLFSSYCFAEKTIIVLEIKSSIGPATQDYVQRGIDEANKRKAMAVILQLNTPGGLEIAMRGINQAILGSRIPIISYVAPSGARAASAGTFIMYASHIAAMAPGTNLGAASPVNIGNPASNKDAADKNQQTLNKKAMNDAVAYIRSLAELRHRNIDWAESAVRQAVSLSADEALKLHVINMIANNIPDLVNKVNGQKIEIQNNLITINTQNSKIETIQPDWRYEFLSIITDPTIAYILLLIGIYGLFFEFANPGFVLPGMAGLIALLLALYAFQLLPINYVGLALLFIGIIGMVAEVFISSFGILGIGGVIAFVAGSILLMDTTVPGYQIASSIIITMTIISFLFFFMVLSLVIRSWRKPVVSGREAMIGAVGEVLEFYPHYSIIRVHGEIWNAYCQSHLEPGQKVRIKKIADLMLTVEPIEKGEK